MAENKPRRLVEEEIYESLERAFQAYGELLETVASFKYLGRVLTAGDNDSPSLTGNLRKYRKSWMWMTKLLIREEADPKVWGLLIKAVVQAVLLFWGRDVGPDPPDGAGP